MENQRDKADRKLWRNANLMIAIYGKSEKKHVYAFSYLNMLYKILS